MTREPWRTRAALPLVTVLGFAACVGFLLFAFSGGRDIGIATVQVARGVFVYEIEGGLRRVVPGSPSTGLFKGRSPCTLGDGRSFVYEVGGTLRVGTLDGASRPLGDGKSGRHGSPVVAGGRVVFPLASGERTPSFGGSDGTSWDLWSCRRDGSDARRHTRLTAWSLSIFPQGHAGGRLVFTRKLKPQAPEETATLDLPTGEITPLNTEREIHSVALAPEGVLWLANPGYYTAYRGPAPGRGAERAIAGEGVAEVSWDAFRPGIVLFVRRGGANEYALWERTKKGETRRLTSLERR